MGTDLRVSGLTLKEVDVYTEGTVTVGHLTCQNLGRNKVLYYKWFVP